MDQNWNAMLQACHQHDPVAREHLFSALRVRLLTVAQYRLRGTSPEAIEDLVQSSLILIFERIDAVESNPDLYALTVLRNKIGDHLRARSRRTERAISPTGSNADEPDDGLLDLELADPDSGAAEAQVESAEAIQVIRRALRKLSPICQALFVGLLEGRAVNEVWELAVENEPRLSRGTFDKRLFDCRKRLRALIGNAI